MLDALCKTMEESDKLREQMINVWCDEMTNVEHEAIRQYFKPFMDRFYNTEEEHEVLEAWERAKSTNKGKPNEH